MRSSRAPSTATLALFDLAREDLVADDEDRRALGSRRGAERGCACVREGALPVMACSSVHYRVTGRRSVVSFACGMRRGLDRRRLRARRPGRSVRAVLEAPGIRGDPRDGGGWRRPIWPVWTGGPHRDRGDLRVRRHAAAASRAATISSSPTHQHVRHQRPRAHPLHPQVGPHHQRSTPLLIISTLRAQHDVDRGLALGANKYLPKPFTPEELRDACARLLAEASARAPEGAEERALRARAASEQPRARAVTHGGRGRRP